MWCAERYLSQKFRNGVLKKSDYFRCEWPAARNLYSEISGNLNRLKLGILSAKAAVKILQVIVNKNSSCVTARGGDRGCEW
jgi:hypothetical protein